MADFDLLARCNEIQQTHVLGASGALLGEKLSKVYAQTVKLESERARLAAERDALKRKLADLEEKNNRYGDNFQPGPSYKNKERKGTFFEQLRRVEAETEREESNKTGLKAVINSLKGQISAYSAKNRKIGRKLEDLREQHLTIEKLNVKKKAELDQQNEALTIVTHERNTLYEACERMKGDTIALSKECQKLDPEVIQKLKLQRTVLENEIKSKKEMLRSVQQAEKAANSQYAAKKKLKQRQLDAKLTPTQWMSERAALLAKVKKARQEIIMLDNRERSASVIETMAQTEKDNMEVSPENIKAAIVAEISSLPTSVPIFLVDAITTEKRYQLRLENQIKDAIAAFARISDGKAKNAQHMGADEEVTVKGPRLALLTEELKDIRRRTQQAA